jgi:hypothetical protein
MPRLRRWSGYFSIYVLEQDINREEFSGTAVAKRKILRARKKALWMTRPLNI